MSTIRLSDYNEIDDIEPGQTLRLNHESCPAGEDTRRRLYITRPHAKPHSVVAYCHNCQSSGYKDTESYQDYRASQHTQVKAVGEVKDVVTPPEGMVENPLDWPNPALQWMFDNRLEQADVLRWGIKYDPSSNRIYLPKYRSTDEYEIQGYQLRKIVNDNSPKYYTVSKTDDTGFTYVKDLLSTNFVLVEDMVSAIHLQNAADINIIINYGTKINIEALYTGRNATRFVVWLDNDSAHVKNQARHMYQTFNLLKNRYITKSYVVQDYSDPKHYEDEEIKGILKETIYG